MDNEKKLNGLTAAEVRKKISQGLVNDFKIDNKNSLWEIIKRNVFTVFNFLNFAIAVLLALVGAWSNLIFFVVIIFNAISGIATEIRAKKMIDKLNLMSKEKITVVRSSRDQKITPEEIVLNDILKISAGEQIPSDAVVLKGVAEANEAMLTGESDLVLKEKGAILLSGSFLASGKVLAEVSHVGADNYASKLMTEAKTHKPINSRILNSLDKIAGFTSKIIIPFGLALFFEALLIKALPTKTAVIYTSTPLLGMLPKGIALLTITSLLTAVVKLGFRKVLVQEMYSVETLAHVDTLCLDKTGTITEGKMKVEDIYYLSKKFSSEEINQLISVYMNSSEDNNPTAQAIRKRFSKIKTDHIAQNIIPFSSDRKWGSMEISGVGTIFLGAPELFGETLEQANKALSRGSRVLALAFSKSKIDNKNIEIPTKISKLALIEITDPIREGAKETLEYLRSQKIDLKIISGDNPITVSNIAQKAGFANFESYIDCSKVKDSELKRIAISTAIFGRVSPHQKKLIIQTLKKSSRTVAMTGDGVNDILALREADCSIVMAEGDPATRQIANLVLLNSDFNDLPEILFEGRRVVNNISRIAPIFFIKTIYSFILAIVCILSALLFDKNLLLVFPFIPIQVTLIDQFVEGFPHFVLTFEKNIQPVEKDFIKKSLLMALPSALMVVFSVIFVRIWGVSNGWITQEISTVSYYLLGSIGMLSVIRACIPLNFWRILLLTWSISAFITTAIFFRPLIEIGVLSGRAFELYAVLMVIFTIFFVMNEWLKKRSKNGTIKA